MANKNKNKKDEFDLFSQPGVEKDFSVGKIQQATDEELIPMMNAPVDEDPEALVIDEIGVSIGKSLEKLGRAKLKAIIEWVLENNPLYEKYFVWKMDFLRYKIAETNTSYTSHSKKSKSTPSPKEVDEKTRAMQIKQRITNTFKEIVRDIPDVFYDDGVIYYSPGRGYFRDGFSLPKEDIISVWPTANQDLRQWADKNRSERTSKILDWKATREKNWSFMQELQGLLYEHDLGHIHISHSIESLQIMHNEKHYTLSISDLVELNEEDQVETIRTWQASLLSPVSSPVRSDSEEITDTSFTQTDEEPPLELRDKPNESERHIDDYFLEGNNPLLEMPEHLNDIPVSDEEPLEAWIEGDGESPHLEIRVAHEDRHEEYYSVSHQVPPNINFHEDTKTERDKQNALELVQNATNKTMPREIEQHLEVPIMLRKCPGIYFTDQGTFDLERMKIENDFDALMVIFDKILKKKPPYHHEYFSLLTTRLLEQWWDKEMQKIIENEDVLTNFFSIISSSLSEYHILKWLGTSSWKSVEFWMTKIVLGMDYMRDEIMEKHNRDSRDDLVFNEWFDEMFSRDDGPSDFEEYRGDILRIVKSQNKKSSDFIKSCPSIINMYISFTKSSEQSFLLSYQKDIIRENLLAIDIPEPYKIYGTPSSSKKSWYVNLNNCRTEEDFREEVKNCWAQSVAKELQYANERDRALAHLLSLSGISWRIKELERQRDNLIIFFDAIGGEMRSYGLSTTLWEDVSSDVYWETLQEWFDLILLGLQRMEENPNPSEEDFHERYILQENDDRMKKSALWESIQLYGTYTDLPSFRVFLYDVWCLPHMFTSYIKKRSAENIVQVYQKNAIAAYIKSLAPQRNSMNYRRKEPNSNMVLSEELLQKSQKKKKHRLDIQYKDILHEFSLFLKTVRLEWLSLDMDKHELKHLSWAKISASKIYLQPRELWGSALQDFMSNEVLWAELDQETPSIQEDNIKIEITSAMIHKLLHVIQDIEIEWIELIEDEGVIRYKWKDIPLQEIVKDGEEEYSLNLWFAIATIDGKYDNLELEIDEASKTIKNQGVVETEEDILKDPESPSKEILDTIGDIVQEIQKRYSSLIFSREEMLFHFRWDSKPFSELTGNSDTYKKQIENWIKEIDLPF